MIMIESGRPKEYLYFCSKSIWCVKKNIQAIAVNYLLSNIYNTIGRACGSALVIVFTLIFLTFAELCM